MRSIDFAVGRHSKPPFEATVCAGEHPGTTRGPTTCPRNSADESSMGCEPLRAAADLCEGPGTSRFPKQFLNWSRCISELDCRSGESSENQRQHMRNLVNEDRASFPLVREVSAAALRRHRES